MGARTRSDRSELLDRIKADFDARLARLAADPAEWVTFIEQVAVFGARYSLHNQLLLMAQAEERGIQPRYFMAYGNREGTTGWKAQGRYVRKGETAFKVWAPVRRRPTDEEVQRWEAEGRTVARDDDGRPTVQLVGFRLVNTFDVSQTDGEPFEVPTVEVARTVRTFGGVTAQLLEGDDPTGVYDDVVKLIKDEGYSFDLASPGSAYLGKANGVTVTAPGLRKVLVRDDVSAAQRLKTTVHELAHIRCGHTLGSEGESLHRGRKETEAESVAHIVCKALGLDSESYTDAYVLTWADGDMELVKECAQTVLRVAKQVLADLTGEADAEAEVSDTE